MTIIDDGPLHGRVGERGDAQARRDASAVPGLVCTLDELIFALRALLADPHDAEARALAQTALAGVPDASVVKLRDVATRLLEAARADERVRLAEMLTQYKAHVLGPDAQGVVADCARRVRRGAGSTPDDATKRTDYAPPDSRRYVTDDADIDRARHVLDVSWGQNGDWYVAVLPAADRFTRACVRVTTSGSKRPEVANAIADLWRALGEDRARQLREARELAAVTGCGVEDAGRVLASVAYDRKRALARVLECQAHNTPIGPVAAPGGAR